MYSVRKELVVFIPAAVGKRQDGDGVFLGDSGGRLSLLIADLCYLCSGFLGIEFWSPFGEPGFPNKVSRHQHQHPDNGEVEFTTGLLGDRLVAVDIFLAFDAIRGHFEGPGKYQHERQAKYQENDIDFQHPFGRTEILGGKFRHLCG